MRESEDIVALGAIVAEMRRLGVVKFRDIELGPDPNVVTPIEQTHVSPEDREKQERADRRSVALAASGGLVKALGRGQ